jgi:hypothetical protein
MRAILITVLLAACASDATTAPVTPPEPEINWDEVPVITATDEVPTYNPLEDMPAGYGDAGGDANLPPMPPLADIGPPEPEELEEPGEMHLREACEAIRPGWCSRFCWQIGANQLHPDAFRTRLRGEWTMYAELDSGEFFQEEDTDETYEAMNERVASSVEARFGDMPLCVCEHDPGVLGEHWVLAVPRERAFFVGDR